LIFKDHRQVPVKIFRAKIALQRATGRIFRISN